MTAERLRLGVAVLTVGLIVAAGLAWSGDHAFGTSWDESGYFDQSLADLQSAQQGGIVALARNLLLADGARPPAYRLLVLPLTLLAGFTPNDVRLVSMIFFVLTTIIVFLTTARIAGQGAGAVAVIFLALCPVVVSSSIVFGTEYPLYLATAATAYFVFRNGHEERTRDWLGLGAALGLGALAKASFVLVAGPVLALMFLLEARGIINSPRRGFLIKAAILGAVIAAPWWLPNLRSAIGYARYAGSFVRHALDASSPADALLQWLRMFAEAELGPGLAILFAGALLILIARRIHGTKSGLDRTQAVVVATCAIAPLPLVVVPLLGANSNTRYFAPDLILVAIGVGVAASRIRWPRPRLVAIAAGAVASLQLASLIGPVVVGTKYPESGTLDTPAWLVMSRQEQWDWEALRTLLRSRGIEAGSIDFLGGAREFNPPAIQYPWARAGKNVPVTWLWRYEDGPIDWAKVMRSASESDVVLTAPNLIGDRSDKDDLDNANNAEFLRRLEQDGRFDGPMYVTMGRFFPTEMAVFIRRGLSSRIFDQPVVRG